MALINTPATGHGNKVENYAGGTTIHYNVFLSSTPKEVSRLNKIKQAYSIIDRLDKKLIYTVPATSILKAFQKENHSVTFGETILFL